MDAWHDQDEWWEVMSQVLFRSRAWELAPLQVEQIMALVGIDPPVRVLDMPCGVGRHSLEFARLGCTVTAVDRTAIYLSEARRRAEEIGLSLELIQADMRQFAREAAFDIAVNLFTSFGYFEDEADDLKVLENFHTSLRPGGALVMEMAGKEVLARDFRERDWLELDDGTLLIEERRITQDWTWMNARWVLIKDGERRDYPLSHRIYGASDLSRLLRQAGFESIRVYGDLSGIDYDQNARRLVVVARKRDELPMQG